MPETPLLTDLTALHRQRRRAMASSTDAMFLQLQAIADVQERLLLVNRSFTEPAIVASFPDLWQEHFPGWKIIPDDDLLALDVAAHDLVVHAMALHWANDPVGQLVQSRRALRPDGLFLGVFPGGETLFELRATLAEAEIAVTGGLSPRVAPMGEIRDLGALLQRAGFALPVADSLGLTVTYDDARHLMRDLRAMGEGNALSARNRMPLRRAVIDETVTRYHDAYGDNGRIPATFELITLTGWAPDESQPKPLRPGSAVGRLADALDTTEHPLPDSANPDRI